MNDGVIDCDIDDNEHSPLARMCIDAHAARKAEKTKKSSSKAKSPVINTETQSKTGSAEESGFIAREIQRDNLLLEMQVKISEMESNLSRKIEQALNLKMAELGTKLGDNANNNALDKSVQTNKNDLRASEILYKNFKARENPAQAILDTLPKILESISNSLDKKYNFQKSKNGGQKNKNRSNSKRPKNTGQNGRQNERNSQ